MVSANPDTEELIRRASHGDPAARQQLLARHRDRLRRMVAVRLDPRLAARVDPSDIVQEAMLDAAQKLSEYLQQRPVPFYPWLRRLAWEHLLKLQRQHLRTRKRSVLREESLDWPLPEESALQLAQQLVASGTSPSRRLLREELRQRVRLALARLPQLDREVLVLRYLEQLPTNEIAAILEINEGVVKMRHRRALDRLCRLLGTDPEGDES
jgi:RNA polymerase sigma-70 factor (ECF subfamily)